MEPSNNRTMKFLASISLGSIFLNVGQLFGLFANAIHWQLLIVAVVLSAFDFVTAMAKLKVLKIEPTSSKQRDSFKKMIQYGGAIIVAYVVWFLARKQVANAGIVVNLTMFAIIFVEITSIGENLYEVNPTGFFGRYFIYPLLYITKFTMVKNPLMKKMEQMQREEEAKQPMPNEPKTS
ncbi:MAG: phage holin family protein [Flavihumibacter sp.]|nr:phage holin family protein [Flavihumibacter sp.]